MSSHPQAIPWRTRPDLQSVEQVAPTSTSYTVKDPVKDEYYYFSQIEYFFLRQLRHPRTLEELVATAALELGRKFKGKEIQEFLRYLARDNLIIPIRFGDGDRLLQLKKVEHRSSRKQALLGLLSIKFPGFHPGDILRPLKPLGWLMFNPVSLMLFLISVVATVLFGAFSFQSLLERVPSFTELISLNHVVAVLIGFVLAKILHELGHSLACQHTNHECGEMGLLLLVFMPCLYCDVSDTWTEKSRWKRILVSLAGVYVELGIAVICFWIWYFTLAGALHNFCYSLMLIASINTLFINGNPLMRYDGYYALADWKRIPNLGLASREALGSQIQEFFLKKDRVVSLNQPTKFLAAYALSAMIYRWLILVAIGFGIWTFFDFQQLRSIGTLVVGTIGLVAAVPLALNLRRSFAQTLALGLRWTRTLAVLGCGILILYGLLGLEFSHRVWSPIEFQLSNPNYLFAPEDGRFVTSINDGDEVRKDDIIGVIDNPEIDLELIRLESEKLEAEMNLQLIELKTDSHIWAGKAEYWKQRKSTLLRQIAEQESKKNQLTIRAPIPGQLVAFQFDGRNRNTDEMSKLSGGLLDAENVDSQIERGDPIAYVGDPARMRGFMRVDQRDVELVKPGQTVKINLPFHDDPLQGSVLSIAVDKDEDDQPTNNRADSKQNSQVHYRVEIELPSHPEIRVGSIHQAVILCQPTNVLKFGFRWLRNSFWF
jgi:putative peptide zinc metalloprotease protein